MSVNDAMAQTFLPGVSRREIEVFDQQARDTWQVYRYNAMDFVLTITQ